MRPLFLAILALAIVGFLFSFGLESSMVSRMQKVQLVKIEANTARLLIGKPADFFVTGAVTFMSDKTADGTRFLTSDQALQLLPRAAFERFFGFARLGCLLALASSLFGLYILRVKPWVVDT